MKIIAIHYGHIASLVYTENVKIINILSEERFSRIKNHWGFSENVLNYIKKYIGIDLVNLDKIIINDKTGNNTKDLTKKNFIC